MLSVTISELRAHCGRDFADHIAADLASLGRTPADEEAIPLTVLAEATWDVVDLLLAMRCCWDRGGWAVGVEVACRAADRAMVNARTEDIPALRSAVDAARGRVAGTVTVEACQDTLDAAYAPARPAAYVYASSSFFPFAKIAPFSSSASYAAYAAYAAATAATAAVPSAAYAAYAATAAYDAAYESAAKRAGDATTTVAAAARAVAVAVDAAARAAADVERFAQRADLLELLAEVGP